MMVSNVTTRSVVTKQSLVVVTLSPVSPSPGRGRGREKRGAAPLLDTPKEWGELEGF
jgi:hypothetical protein